MGIKIKEIDIKIRSYYFFDDMINIKNLIQLISIKSPTKKFLFITLDMWQCIKKCWFNCKKGILKN